jgi:hypothetical protein
VGDVLEGFLDVLDDRPHVVVAGRVEQPPRGRRIDRDVHAQRTHAKIVSLPSVRGEPRPSQHRRSRP